ncbi:centrosomal protein of 131 kDa isoform X2 [Ceratina calcarata]|uniref:Centrosomal protein of 131 kDa isoform X2 n=1 Tax=Ceratina calcarata TaxID=156304 RepID=A0AAJ7S9E6_9HYME|nr:centrosomal protein of 131 kDa isoform X2 [Ceratina calcarata]
MINIAHPKIRGKPPVKKPPPPPRSTEGIQEIKSVDDDSKKIERADCNQNVVESTTCSFEELCTMITDLERDIVGQLPEMQLQPERDDSKEERAANGTTYEDIMSFLAKLEDGSLDETNVNVPEVDATILGEIFDGSLPRINYDSVERVVPRAFEEDLATARLQLEEKNATVSLLREKLNSERKLFYEKVEAQKKKNSSKFQQQEEKYKSIVKRHQSFIEQLISEKSELTEKCNSLVQRVKEIEIKMQRDLKVADDRYAVELQRAKEHFAAAEKIKRERWIEARTTRIKEMTVKGLEPELRNMMEQHAEEVQRLRNAHVKELQDAELRIVRRSNQQLEQLRIELTASHERMLTNEKSILWARYQEKLEEQENQFKAQQAKLVDELQLDREKFGKEQAKRDAETEALLQRMRLQYQQEIDALRQQHSHEKNTLQESLKTEWEAWLADYKRQQNLRIEQMENKIRDDCNRERDRQIELAIERLEKDSRNAKLALQQNFDCKLRSLREKYEIELQTAMENEQIHKAKWTHTKDKLERTLTELQQTENKIQECTSELSKTNEAVKQLTAERDNAKRIARQEIEGEKRELEEKIGSLYQEITRINVNRDVSLAQLRSRIKLIMTQKILAIKNLTKELNDAKLRCEHLEKLLDQQRREYVLKDI